MSDDINPEGASDEQWMPLPNVNQLPPPRPPGTGPTPPPFMSPPPVDLGPLTSSAVPGPPSSTPPNRRPRWLLPVVAVLVLGGGATAIGISASRDSDDKVIAETDPPFKTVETDPVFETDPTVFETDPTVFETDPTVFETDPTVFETDPTVFETDPTVFETDPPVDEPLPTFALNSGLVQPADLSYPVEVVSSDPATAPCSDQNAFKFVPSTSDVAAAQTDTFFYLVQAGSFATASEADQFIDDLSSIQPCNFVHSNGVTETVTDIRFVGPVLAFTWQFDTADGSQVFGVDGYFSDGKAVGVFSCSGDVEPKCTEMANAFITRLDSAVTEFS